MLHIKIISFNAASVKTNSLHSKDCIAMLTRDIKNIRDLFWSITNADTVKKHLTQTSVERTMLVACIVSNYIAVTIVASSLDGREVWRSIIKIVSNKKIKNDDNFI